jgi:hypothetical protein
LSSGQRGSRSARKADRSNLAKWTFNSVVGTTFCIASNAVSQGATCPKWSYRHDRGVLASATVAFIDETCQSGLGFEGSKMVDFSKLKTTLAYARLGLVSLTATIAPITGTAQELQEYCGTELFEGEPDAMNLTVELLGILESNGVVAFQGSEGRISIDAARRSLQDGVGSAILLACVVDSNSIEFAVGARNRIIGCNTEGAPSLFRAGGPSTGSTTGRLFCTREVVAFSRYLGSEA